MHYYLGHAQARALDPATEAMTTKRSTLQSQIIKSSTDTQYNYVDRLEGSHLKTFDHVMHGICINNKVIAIML